MAKSIAGNGGIAGLVLFWAGLGTQAYPPRTARRLAVINVLSAMVALMTIPYILLYIAYDWRGLIIPIVTLSPQVVLYAITPVWNRVGPYASAIYLSAVWLVFALLYSWYFGRDSGLHYYFLPGAAASMLVCGVDKMRYSALITLAAFVGFTVAERMFQEPAGFLTITATFNDIMFVLSAPFAFMLIFLTVLFAFHEATRAEDRLEEEYARSERILNSMLPESVAARLKGQPGTTIADSLASATILFADIASFTPRAARLRAPELLEFLNDIFGRFDRLTAEHGLERIKTVGDAYMAAGGLSNGDTDHRTAALRLAQAFHHAASEITLAGEPVRLRIGINTGPVMAGVIGHGRIAYDTWGDTVNLASRMEETAPVGATQLTESVREGVENFEFEPRGPIDVRGYGVVRTWLLHDDKRAASPMRDPEPST